MRFLAFMLLLLTAQSRVGAEPVPEYVMKATYLYNFAVYTEWPAELGNEIQLCVLGEERFGGALQTISGKFVNGRILMVHNLMSIDQIGACQILYLGEADVPRSQEALRKIRGMPILTVADGIIPLYSGVMISMLIEDKRLAFKVNASAARKVQLNFSSKLLRLASSVY